MDAIRPRISVEYTEKATIIGFADQKILEETDIRALQDSLSAVIEQSTGQNFVLDFSNVRFLSSAVLGLLIRISKKIYEQGGQLKLANIDSKIYEIFKITRLTKVFDIHDSVVDACESISGPGSA